MATDLFHAVARTYYGVSPELHAIGCSANQGSPTESSATESKTASGDSTGTGYALGDARKTATGKKVKPVEKAKHCDKACGSKKPAKQKANK